MWYADWIWLVVLLFFLVFFGGIFFLVNHSIQIQKKTLQTIYQEQYTVRMEVIRLAKALDSLLADREVNDLTPVQTEAVSQVNAMPAGMDRLLLSNQGKTAKPLQPFQADSSMLDLKM